MTLPDRFELFFDPACPWTWNTSRWLVEATGRCGATITWRSLSLDVVKDEEQRPELLEPKRAAASAAHRVIAALRHDSRNDAIGALYAEYGRRIHHDATPPSVDVVREIVTAVAPDRVAAVDEPSWDESVRASTREAMELAGPDVGSPVLAWGEPRVGWFGPIVSPPPTGDDAVRLLELVVSAAQVPGFAELKRSRNGGPQLGPAPDQRSV